MPDRDDAPDPMDEAFLRAEQALDDEAARAARRARVLAAVAQEPPASQPAVRPARRTIRRYGGWLAAACVAGISVVTAEQVYRLSPRRDQIAPPKVQPPASPVAKAPPPAAVPPPSIAAQTSSAPPPVTAPAAPQPIVPAPPVAPPPDIAPPPPLPIPPVERPLQAAPPPPLPIPPVEKPILAPPAPAPPPPTALAEPGSRVAQDVVVNARRASPPVTASSAALAAKTPDGASRLRDAAFAGRTAEIETLLARGVPVDALDENGETALMKAIEAAQRDAAALLRRHGASLDHRSRAGVSVRDMALQKGDPELDQALGLNR